MNDNILFQTLRLISKILRVLFLIFVTFMIALFNDFGWLVGLGANGYLGRKIELDNYRDAQHLKRSEPVKVSFDSVSIDSLGEITYADNGVIRGCNLDDNSDKQIKVEHSLNSLLDNDFYTRSETSLERKLARINRAVITASVATVRLRQVITNLKEGKSAGVSQDDSYYCGAHSSNDNYRLWSDASFHVRLSHAPEVVLNEGVACLASYDGPCTPKAYFYADLFSVKLPPEQEAAEAAMLQMGTEEFWLTAAHENGVHNDAAIRASVAAFHRILNERYPHFDEGGVQDTKSATFKQLIGLQNFGN